MVAVLFVQQLFGAYHILYSHLDECVHEISDGQALVSQMDTQCDVCAKLNGATALFEIDQYLDLPTDHYAIIHQSSEQRLIRNRFATTQQRGPPFLV